MTFSGGGGLGNRLSSLFGGMGGGGQTAGTGLVRLGVDTSTMRQSVRKGVNDIKSELDRGATEIQGKSKLWSTAFAAVKVAAVGSLVGIAGALTGAAAASISYEAAFAGVIKTTGAAPPVLDKLRKGFIELSTQIPISANQLAALGEAAGALGIPVENIQDFVRVTALLGTTTNVSADDAATALGQLSNVLGLTGADYERFASTLVQLGNTGASTESQILEIANRAGAVGHNIGLSTQTILAFSSAVANMGVEVEAGGTALQMMFTRLSLLLTDKDKLAELGKVAGMTGDQFKTAFLKDAQGAIISFLGGLSKLNSVDQAVVLQDLGLAGARTSRVYVGLANSLDRNLLPAIDSANEGWAENIALQKAADTRFGTTAAKLTILKNRVTALLIELGDHLTPAIADAAKWLSDKIPAAAAVIADAWNNVLGPAIGGMLDGFGHLAGAVVGIFTGGQKAVDWGEALKGAFNGLVGILAEAAHWLGTIADFVGGLLQNQIISNLVKFVALWTGFRVAVDGISRAWRSITAGGAGRLGSFVNFLTFGASGTTGTASKVNGAAGVGGAAAAGGLEGAAALLEKAAQALLAAAERLGVAGGVGTAGAAIGGAGAIPAVAAGAGAAQAEAAGAKLAQAEAKAMATGVEKAMVAQGSRGLFARFAAAGKSMFSGIGSALAGGFGFLRSGAGLAARGLGAVAGIAGKLFWPAMIASFAIDLAAQPVGDFVANTLGKKNLGAQMSKDLLGGIGTWVTSVINGVDVEKIANLETDTITVAGIKISAVQAAKMGFTRGEITSAFVTEADFTGTIKQIEIAKAKITQEGPPPTFDITGLDQKTGETVQEYSDRLIQQANELGLNWKDALGAALEEAIKSGKADEFKGEFDPAFLSRLAALISGKEQEGIDATTAALRQKVGAKLEADYGFTHAQVLALTDVQISQLGQILDQNVSGELDGYVKGILAEVQRRLSAYEPPIPSGPTTPLTNAERRRQRGLFEGAAGPTAQGGATSPHVQEGLSAKAAIAAFNKQLQDDLEVQGEPMHVQQELAQHWLDQWGAAIAGAKTDKQKAALAKQLGFDSWDQVLAQEKDALTRSGQQNVLDLATAYAKIQTDYVKQGIDFSSTATGKEMRQMLIDQLGNAGLSPDVRQAITDALGITIPGAVHDQMPGLQKSVYDTTTTAVTDGVTQGQPTYRKQGEQIMHGVVEGAGGYDTSGLITDLLKNAVAPSDQTNQEAYKAGVQIMLQIALGMRSDDSLAAIGKAVATAMSRAHSFLPSSPVKEGPLKHPYLFEAGKRIIGQIGEGMKAATLGFPDMAAGGLATAAATKGAGVAGAHSSSYNFERVYLQGPRDDQSLLDRLSFLDPTRHRRGING